MKILQKILITKGLFLKFLFLFEIISSIPLVAIGQRKHHDSFDDWSFGLKLGSNHFSGDLSSNYLFFPSINVDGRNGMTVGGFAGKRISPTCTAKLDGEFSNLYDTGINYNHEYFNSKIIQVNISVDADLFYIFFNASSRFKILPYAGIGLTFYHTSVFDQKSNQLLRDTSYDSMIGINSLSAKKNVAFNIPIGLKVTQKLGKTIEVGVDFRVNNTLTDKLDATIGGDNSSIYKDGRSLDMIPTNSWYDAWGYMGLTLTYKIPVQNKNYIKSSRYL